MSEQRGGRGDRGDSRWGLRLISLGMALALWFFVSLDRLEEQSQRLIEAPVTFNNLPENLIILNLEEVQRRSVLVQGNARAISGLDPRSLGVVVDLKGTSAGLHTVQLGAEHVLRPRNIEVVSVEPAGLQLRLDQRATRVLPVETDFTGEPSAGARLVRWEIIPRQVVTSGPQSILEDIDVLRTKPVDLTGHALSFEKDAAFDLPDPAVKPQPPTVTVRVDLEVPEVSGGNAPARRGRGMP